MSGKANAERGHRAGWGVTGALIAVLLLILATSVNRCESAETHNNAETKHNLHNIQLAVERYAVDHDGSYPQYLIGGEPALDANGIPLTGTASDPLLREGYLNEYPRNPFNWTERQTKQLLSQQATLAKTSADGDPLRPGHSEGDLHGYRFGAEGWRMGQVLCDVRWTMWTYEDPATGAREKLHTWADVEYRMWDTWDDKQSTHGDGFLEGQFFYKSNGPVIYRQSDGVSEPYPWDADDPFIPTEIDSYIMGAYGSRKTPGKDVLGSINPVAPYNNSTPSLGSQLKLLRSEYAADGTEGCPFSFDPLSVSGNERIAYGNPNGIRDGVILVLTAGEGYTGDR